MKKVLIIIIALVALTSCSSKKNEVDIVQQINEEQLEQEASDYAFNEFVVKYKFLQQVYLSVKQRGLSQKDFRRCYSAQLSEINMLYCDLDNMLYYDLEKVFVTNSDEFLDAMTKKYKNQYKMWVLENAYEHNLKVINAVNQIDPNTPKDKKVTIKI